MRLLWIVLLTLVLASAIGDASAQQIGPRVALVIGNANYPDADAPLKQPLQDAHALADELKAVGFDVTIADNQSKQAIRKTLDGFFKKIKPNSVALVFFSGFGIQSVRQTYLIPVDGQIWTESDIRR